MMCAAQYPSAQAVLAGVGTAGQRALVQSIQIAWPPPSGPTMLVVLWPSFFRPSTISPGTAVLELIDAFVMQAAADIDRLLHVAAIVEMCQHVHCPTG